MSSNPFSNDSLVPNWTEATRILKEDQEGHPFRGNQYTQGVGGGGHTPAQLDPTRNQVETDRYHGRDDDPARWTSNDSQSRTNAGSKALDTATKARTAIANGSLDEALDLHREAADKHQSIADLKSTDPVVAQAHQDAADAHRSVVFSLRGMPAEASLGELKDLSEQAERASKDALNQDTSDAATQELIETYGIKVDGKNNASVKGLDFVVEGTPLERMREDDSKLADALSARLGKLGSKFGATVKVERLHGPQGHPTISVDGPRDKVVAFIRQYDEGTI